MTPLRSHLAMPWIAVAKETDCSPGAGTEIVVEGRIVALFNVDGVFYAMDGVCPHQGGPLGKGQLDGCTLTCPWHGWQFDVRDGQSRLSVSVRQPTLPTKIEGGKVYVELEADSETDACG